MRSGYLDAQVGASSLAGLYAHVEAGARLTERLGLFAFGRATRQESMAGAGVRYTFGW
ncbi:hypothetical protein [Myxococcus sp. AB036A]|uniref:hypothetical protein n=1 Tax=Myxococcus sp. AB036A TaxID=2562793 RepID=UPI001E4C3DEB|nr:hypothetical protein [Myxococcus sp. AB036A]